MIRARGGAFLALALAALAPRVVRAQIPDTAAVRDSTRRDTTDYTELFLKAEEDARHRVRPLPRLNAPGLMPALTRIVFDRDTIDWSTSETLGDLLTKVPGVYLWRGGWIGRPEMVNYQAHGAQSLEVLLDGVPYRPLGPDSVSVDPSLMPLSFLDRVEVERLPGLLKVYLYTRRHDRLTPRTRVGVASGDYSIARYEGSLERRSKSGIGFVVAAEHLAVPLSRDQQGAYHNTQAWLQLSYVPAKKFAANLQLVRSGPDRGDVLSETKDTLSAGLRGKRTDLQGSVSYAPRTDGLGPRLTLALAYSSWREDSTALVLGNLSAGHQHVRLVDQSLAQIGGIAETRSSTSFARASAWYRSRWTPLEARAELGSSPTRVTTATVEAGYQRHDGGRSSHWVTARAGLRLPLGFEASGMYRYGSQYATPMLTALPAQSLRDAAVLVAFERPRVALEVGYWRTGGFSPQPYPLYRTIAGFAPVGATEWRTVSARLAPKQWFVLDGWYSDAVGQGPQGVPPTHSIVNATVQSKFLPTFRSGIFGLKLRGTMEAFGTGVIGLDRDGAPIELKGATFFRGQIQLQIGSFIAYWDRYNLQASRLAYVPGLPLLSLASTFGVRWEFSN